MTRSALADMTTAGLVVLDLLTIPEVALRLGCSQKKVRRLAADGVLTRVDMGALARITPGSVAAYEQRQAAGAQAP